MERPDGSEGRPLSEAVLVILASLADRPRHGYALMKNIEAVSNLLAFTLSSD
ncbi:MAG: hypothetical protein LAP38_04150 [Acidobacteriia bacterium]|nr:hypothetical protein [Terriglobia bacterium]